MIINNIEVNPQEVKVTERSIVAEDLLQDLKNGLTWYKKDDLGYGSIQDKYNANPMQIQILRKHPMFKDVKTEITVFTIISSETPVVNTTQLEFKPEPQPISTPAPVQEIHVMEARPAEVLEIEGADAFGNI